MRDSVLKHRAYSVAAMRELARRRLPRAVFDFVDGGAEDGVARVLEIYRSEIDRIMALCGWDRLDQIDRSVLFDPAARPESILGAFSRKVTSMLK